MKLSADDLRMLRKQASTLQGQLFLQERFGAPALSAVDRVLLHKTGQVKDPELLAIAAAVRPDAPLATYEGLGGRYHFER